MFLLSRTEDLPVTSPAKPTLAANLAAQLGQVQPAVPPPAHITINVQAGASLTLLVGGASAPQTEVFPTSQAS
jgi:hypothetical protein